MPDGTRFRNLSEGYVSPSLFNEYEAYDIARVLRELRSSMLGVGYRGEFVTDAIDVMSDHLIDTSEWADDPVGPTPTELVQRFLAEAGERKVA